MDLHTAESVKAFWYPNSGGCWIQLRLITSFASPSVYLISQARYPHWLSQGF